MSAKTERLLNLIGLFQRSSGWTTRAELQRVVPEYAGKTSDAFERMFERDKADLRDIGLRIDTGPEGAQGDEVGYRITAEEHQLPAMTFDAADLTILALAARAWRTAALEREAQTGALKISALADGVVVADDPQFDLRLPDSGQWLPAVFEAIRERRTVQFRYRSISSGTTASRTVQPWQLLTRRGAWYLVGHDVDREAPRIFRTSRIVDQLVPIGPDRSFERPPQSVVNSYVDALTSPETDRTATIRVQRDRAHALRRAATNDDASTAGVLTVPYASDDALASQIVALGGAAIAVSPPSLIEAVTTHAAALIEAHAAAAGGRP